MQGGGGGGGGTELVFHSLQFRVQSGFGLTQLLHLALRIGQLGGKRRDLTVELFPRCLQLGTGLLLLTDGLGQPRPLISAPALLGLEVRAQLPVLLFQGGDLGLHVLGALAEVVGDGLQVGLGHGDDVLEPGQAGLEPRHLLVPLRQPVLQPLDLGQHLLQLRVAAAERGLERLHHAEHGGHLGVQ